MVLETVANDAAVSGVVILSYIAAEFTAIPLLYISLDGENQEIKTDELVSLKLDSLMQVAPAEDVAKLYSLMDDYVSASQIHNFHQQNPLLLNTPQLQYHHNRMLIEAHKHVCSGLSSLLLGAILGLIAAIKGFALNNYKIELITKPSSSFVACQL